MGVGRGCCYGTRTSSVSLVPAQNREVCERLGSRTYPAGCCIIDTKSSTAVLAAILANPGLVTVHIWSSVLSVKLYSHQPTNTEEQNHDHNGDDHDHGGDDGLVKSTRGGVCGGREELTSAGATISLQ